MTFIIPFSVGHIKVVNVKVVLGALDRLALIFLEIAFRSRFHVYLSYSLFFSLLALSLSLMRMPCVGGLIDSLGRGIHIACMAAMRYQLND